MYVSVCMHPAAAAQCSELEARQARCFCSLSAAALNDDACQGCLRISRLANAWWGALDRLMLSFATQELSFSQDEPGVYRHRHKLMALASFPPSFTIQSQAPSSRRSQVPGGLIRGGSADELHLTVTATDDQGVWSGRFGLGSGRGSFLQTSFGRQKQTQGSPRCTT
jgi:hypothetical protein